MRKLARPESEGQKLERPLNEKWTFTKCRVTLSETFHDSRVTSIPSCRYAIPVSETDVGEREEFYVAIAVR